MTLADFISNILEKINVNVDKRALLTLHRATVDDFNKNFNKLNNANKKLMYLQSKKIVEEIINKNVDNNESLLKINMEIEFFQTLFDTYCKVCTNILINIDSSNIKDYELSKAFLYETLLLIGKDSEPYKNKKTFKDDFIGVEILQKF